MAGRCPAAVAGTLLVAAALGCDTARGPVFDWGDGGSPSTSQCGAGLACGLRGEYFQMPSYEGRAFNAGALVLTRVDPQVSFDWGSGAPDPALQAQFLVRWTGFLRVPPNGAAGGQSYRFTVRADDGVRLWVDERPLIDDWNDHTATEDTGDVTLAAGASVPIKLEYYQHMGTASVALAWTPPGQPSAPIPTSALSPPPETNGLVGTYFAGASFDTTAVTRVDQDVAFRWGLDSPDPAVPTDHFSARWTGTIEARYSELFTFTARVAETNEGVRLTVNDAPVIDAWNAPAAPPTIESQGTIALEAGRRHPITLEYSESIGGARLELLWASASQPETRVSWSRLRPGP